MVPIPLLPPLPPNDSGLPRDPFGKEEENLFGFSSIFLFVFCMFSLNEV